MMRDTQYICCTFCAIFFIKNGNLGEVNDGKRFIFHPKSVAVYVKKVYFILTTGIKMGCCTENEMQFMCRGVSLNFFFISVHSLKSVNVFKYV